MKAGFLLLLLLTSSVAFGQVPSAPASETARPPEDPKRPLVADIPVNYDEAKVGTYTLPDPLLFPDGKPVRDAAAWYKKRRPEIVELFEENQYGRAPGRPAGMSFDVFEKGTPAGMPLWNRMVVEIAGSCR